MIKQIVFQFQQTQKKRLFNDDNFSFLMNIINNNIKITYLTQP